MVAAVIVVRRGPRDILYEVQDALGESGKNLTTRGAPSTKSILMGDTPIV